MTKSKAEKLKKFIIEEIFEAEENKPTFSLDMDADEFHEIISTLGHFYFVLLSIHIEEKIDENYISEWVSDLMQINEKKLWNCINQQKETKLMEKIINVMIGKADADEA